MRRFCYSGTNLWLGEKTLEENWKVFEKFLKFNNDDSNNNDVDVDNVVGSLEIF